jgi:hypothetical protein
MGELEMEMALDGLEAELAAELPAHVRAFAHAHAAGEPAPPAPPAARRVSSVALAYGALAQPALAARGLALLRLAAPTIVENNSGVTRARAEERAWPGLTALTAARDAASRARFGLGCIALMHTLHGAGGGRGKPASGPHEPPAGWKAPDRTIGPDEIDEVWHELARRYGAVGRLELVASETARPRAFVVEPGREVIAVVPARVETPGARFAVLHELGHALAGLVVAAPLPRAIDEAAASYAARAMEAPDHPWHSALAAEARARRTALATMLDEIERGTRKPAAAKPPWALWHDPGAQASYVRAEQIADAWAGETLPLSHRIARDAEAIAHATVPEILKSLR